MPDTLVKVMEWARLLTELGFAVYTAVQSGDTSKTVGEIFAERRLDMDTVRALEDQAREHFDP